MTEPSAETFRKFLAEKGVAVKDMTDVAGQPATSGAAVLAGRIADQDAPAVARLRAQGAVLIGKVATYEFGMVGPDLNLPDPPARTRGTSITPPAAPPRGRLSRWAGVWCGWRLAPTAAARSARPRPIVAVSG